MTADRPNAELTARERALVEHWGAQGYEAWSAHIRHVLNDRHVQCVECAVLVARMKDKG